MGRTYGRTSGELSRCSQEECRLCWFEKSAGFAAALAKDAERIDESVNRSFTPRPWNLQARFSRFVCGEVHGSACIPVRAAEFYIIRQTWLWGLRPGEISTPGQQLARNGPQSRQNALGRVRSMLEARSPPHIRSEPSGSKSCSRIPAPRGNPSGQ